MTPQSTPPDWLAAELNLARAEAELGDPAVVADVLGLLAESLPGELEQIDAALARQDLGAARAVLHPLKGFVPSFVSEALAEQIGQLERLCRDTDPVPVVALYAAVRPRLLRLLLDIERHTGG